MASKLPPNSPKVETTSIQPVARLTQLYDRPKAMDSAKPSTEKSTAVTPAVKTWGKAGSNPAGASASSTAKPAATSQISPRNFAVPIPKATPAATQGPTGPAPAASSPPAAPAAAPAPVSEPAAPSQTAEPTPPAPSRARAASAGSGTPLPGSPFPTAPSSFQTPESPPLGRKAPSRPDGDEPPPPKPKKERDPNETPRERRRRIALARIEKIRKYREAVAVLQSDNEKLVEHVKNVAREASRYKAMSTRASTENEDLKQQVQTLTGEVSMAADMQTAMEADLTRVSEEHEKEKAQLEAQLEELQSTVEQLRSSPPGKAAASGDGEDASALREQLKDALSDLETMKSNKAIYEQARAGIEKDLRTQVQQLRADVDRLRKPGTKEDEVYQAMDKLRKQHQEAIAEIDKLKAENKKLEAGILKERPQPKKSDEASSSSSSLLHGTSSRSSSSASLKSHTKSMLPTANRGRVKEESSSDEDSSSSEDEKPRKPSHKSSSNDEDTKEAVRLEKQLKSLQRDFSKVKSEKEKLVQEQKLAEAELSARKHELERARSELSKHAELVRQASGDATGLQTLLTPRHLQTNDPDADNANFAKLARDLDQLRNEKTTSDEQHKKLEAELRLRNGQLMKALEKLMQERNATSAEAIKKGIKTKLDLPFLEKGKP
eukprot:TRINITY_DN10250_c0_g1_i1.p1 TRINITY_DN10250_c0_g1~~TRINITY_DN10250_c0_g1_i1.p1  ORF type:complete len:663 (-),score=222.61 TRINITY_DN10250_c0_g1_i1:108-2096(-)